MTGLASGGRWRNTALDFPLGHWTPAPEQPHEVAPGVRWLRMPLPMRLDHINLWLLDDRDAAGPGTAIVDTGMNASVCRDVWQALLPTLRITRVIGTHFHPDHVGLAGWLGAHAGVRLFMTQAEYLMGRLFQLDARTVPPAEVIEMAVEASWPESAIAALRVQSWSRMSKIMTTPPDGYHRMKDGDRLDIGGRMWRVVVGRGHSPEHACLVAEDGDVMISGDQVLPEISSNVSVHAIEPMADALGDWLDSIARLKELPEQLLVLPAHGLPFYGLHTRLDQLDGEHREKLEALHDFCGTSRTIYECFPILFTRGVDDSVIPMASGEALAHLRRLECEGRVVRERHGRQLRFRAV